MVIDDATAIGSRRWIAPSVVDDSPVSSGSQCLQTLNTSMEGVRNIVPLPMTSSQRRENEQYLSNLPLDFFPRCVYNTCIF